MYKVKEKIERKVKGRKSRYVEIQISKIMKHEKEKKY